MEARYHYDLCFATITTTASNYVFFKKMKNCGRVFCQGGFAMRQYLPNLMPLIVNAILDGAAVMKREVAVSTLGQVVQSTGYVRCFLCFAVSIFL